MLGMRKALPDDGFDEFSQRPPETADVDEHHGLPMEVELLPGDDLDRLVERPEAAGKHDERVGELEHRALAIVHARNHAELRQRFVRDFETAKKFGNHADDFAAGAERRVGEDPHETDPPAAVDEADASGGDRLTEPGGGAAVSFVDPDRRAAEHTD